MSKTALQVIQGENRDELIKVLQASLYAGAKTESVAMVLSYCEAAKLDPMQKPVHLVPMNTKNAQTGKYECRDVIMPGIGLYRIQADRSGTMAGISEPEFGDEVTATMKDKSGKDVTFSYPEWCRVSVKKIVGSHIVDFVAKEYWIENYATAGRDADAPNAMWLKRPRGQIAKCAEAQALRKAFPEVGAQPTAEEMEGKMISEVAGAGAVQIAEVVGDGTMSIEKFNEAFPKYETFIQNRKKTANQLIEFIEGKGSLLSDHQKEILRKVEEEMIS